jgi:hypothetical protein
MKKIIQFFFSALMFSSCEKVIQLDLPDLDSRIVVDGLITNEDTTYNVILTRTTKYNFVYDTTKLEYEEGALVIVSDDVNNIDTLEEITPGKYRTHQNKIRGQIGRTYKADIFTKAGTHFLSMPEQMLDVPKIDSIYFTRDFNDISPDNPQYYKYTIYVDYHDPANVHNYYLRNMSYFWANKWHDNVQWNWVFNDKYSNGMYLKKDIANDGYGGRNWLFRLNQYSLTEKAYTFWNLVHEQTNLSGDGYSNASVPLIGNIYNVNNPKDYALGYFQVSAKVTAEIYINR